MAANSDMNFTEYEKMSQDMSKFVLDREFNKIQWMVTEKIHGANFSFHTDGETVRVARRRDFLQSRENFYNYLTASFYEFTPDKIKNVFRNLEKLFPDEELIQVSVYGELFGGKYIVDGKDMNTTNQKPIQQEIQYCPMIDWMAFDISYTTKNAPTEHHYVDPEESIKIFQSNDINYMKSLFIGKMNEALTYQLGFDSTIPSIYKLPKLPKGSNKAEGVVVKPLKNVISLTKKNHMERVIIKIKLPEFDEIRKSSYTTKPKNPNAGKKKQTFISKLMCYVTQQRLVSALTKVGGNDSWMLELENIKKEFIEDVFRDVEEFDENLHKEWNELNQTERSKNMAFLEKKFDRTIKQYIDNCMTNT